MHRQHSELAFPKKGMRRVQESTSEVDGTLPGAEETWTVFAEHSIVWLPCWDQGWDYGKLGVLINPTRCNK